MQGLESWRARFGMHRGSASGQMLPCRERSARPCAEGAEGSRGKATGGNEQHCLSGQPGPLYISWSFCLVDPPWCRERVWGWRPA